jgi:Cdc6-like AAA superfamily ATPase
LDEFDQLTTLLNKKSQSNFIDVHIFHYHCLVGGKMKANSNAMMVFTKLCHLLLRSEINQRIVMIGISNAHSYASLSNLLTDKTSTTFQLHTIVFKPYTVEDMRDIILHRLETAKTHMQQQLESNNPNTPVKLLHEDFQKYSPLTSSEVSFITQKLASQSGDCRKLLDVCR